MSGRVKTLQSSSPRLLLKIVLTYSSPAVHAGILARNLESDEKDLAEQNIRKVDYVSAFEQFPSHQSIDLSAKKVSLTIRFIAGCLQSLPIQRDCWEDKCNVRNI